MKINIFQSWKKTIGYTSLIWPLLPVVNCFWDVFSKACKFTEILVSAFKVYKKTDYCREAMMNYSIGALWRMVNNVEMLLNNSIHYTQQVLEGKMHLKNFAENQNP